MYEVLNKRAPSINITPKVSPPALQVDSTASHHIALTAEGELLTWNCRRATSRQEHREFAVATRPAPPPVTSLLQGDHAWRPARSGDYSSCRISRAVFDCQTGCVEAGHGDMPIVWQVLACKPSVADVACGQEHTLALLETGQVRERANFIGGTLCVGK